MNFFCEAEIKQRFQFLFIILIALSLTACASRVKPSLFPATEQTADCDAFLKSLDEAVFEAGVNNASVFRVDGFPYFRTNRFLSELKSRVTSDAEKDLWIEWMLAEDMITRYIEISCLPGETRESLARQVNIEPTALELATHAGTCATALLNAHREQPGFYSSLVAAVDCPEEYKTAMRVAGLYPLVSLPIAYLTKRAHKRMTGWLRQSPGAPPPTGVVASYLPEQSPASTAEEIKRIIQESSDNALFTPIPDAAAQETLVKNFAPIIMQEITDDVDRFGTVSWQDNDIIIDGDRPTVYYYFTHAFYRDKPTLQINYVLWYPAREGPGAPTLEWGELDGLTIRISLDSDGSPVMTDIMNSCGCYHFFVPAEDTVRAIKPQPRTIDAFAPVRLPAPFPENRLNLHVNADWHQVTSLTAEKPEAENFTYRLIPYETLEMLPRADGSQESLFNKHGIAKGSDRIEPFIFFSMGIPKVGSMRQRSHHALKLVGRAYFSDPNLFDQNFEFAE